MYTRQMRTKLDWYLKEKKIKDIHVDFKNVKNLI